MAAAAESRPRSAAIRGAFRAASRGAILTAILAVALPAFLVACASTDDFDPEAAAADLMSERGPAAAPLGTPWSFLKGSMVWVTDRRVDRAATEESLKLVLMQELRRRGRPPAAPGDARALLGFVLVLERELDDATVSRILGQDPTRGAAGARRVHAPGTLVLQVVDATTGELVWRGALAAGVALDQDAEVRNARLRRAAGVLLDDFTGPG